MTSAAPRQKPTPAHLALLDKAFGNDGWEIEKALAGYSGAAVYQISVHKKDRVIVKIAHRSLLEREAERYRAFVWSKLPNGVPKIGDQLVANDDASADGDLALLQYTFAGAGQPKTLQDYLEKADGKAFAKILQEILHEYGDQWWQDSHRKRVKGRVYYDRFLPPHLQLVQFSAPPSGEALTLHAGQLEPDELAALPVGAIVHLHEFRIEQIEISPAGPLLTLNDEQGKGETPRITLLGATGNRHEQLPPTYAYVKATRATALATYVQSSSDGISNGAVQLTIAGEQYPNPVPYLNALLDEPYATRLSIIHGDLNLRNILAEEEKKAYKRSWLIDFADTGEGPVLLDLQWLETQVINWLLIPALLHARLSPHTLTIVLTALHQHKALPLHLYFALHRPYAMLQALRQEAESYLLGKPDDEKRWQEYYRGLTVQLTATLKYTGILTPEQRKLALIGAATTLQWTGLPLPEPPRRRPVWLFPLVSALCGIMLGVFVTRNLSGVVRPPSTPAAAVTPAMSPPVTLTPTAVPSPTPPVQTLLSRVKQRGHLRCGINGEVPRFSQLVATANATISDQATGFDPDFCRAVAIAVFGTAEERVKFIELSTKERFDRLTDGTVDVMVRNTTWTAGRMVGRGFDFGPVTFYTGQAFLVHKEVGIDQIEDLAGKTICATGSTTTVRVLESLNHTFFGNRGRTEFVIAADYESDKAILGALRINDCDAMVTDTYLAELQRLQLGVDKERYKIIPGDGQEISYLPQGPLVVGTDRQWRNLVHYAVWTPIYGEMLGINRANVDDYRAKDEPLYQKFFGADEEIKTNLFQPLGAVEDFTYRIIKEVGNYADIYDRHLMTATNGVAVYLVPRGPNQVSTRFNEEAQLWEPNPEGKLFSPPFEP